MKINNYISLKSVMWRVLRNPLANEMTYEELAEFALEFIKLLGAPVIYETKLEFLDLDMHKTALPCGIISIDGVRYLNTTEDRTVDQWIALRESSNIYHLDALEHRNEQDTDFNLRGNHRRLEFTYTINNGILFTSPRDGKIEIAYKGIVTDEDGYPMIPDNEKVMLGMEYYILSRYLEPLYIMGKISDKAFEFIQQKRYFYTPSAYTSLTMPSVDGMTTLMNSLNRLVLSGTSQETFFKKMGQHERIRKFR